VKLVGTAGGGGDSALCSAEPTLKLAPRGRPSNSHAMGPIGGMRATINSHTNFGRFWMRDWSVLITSNMQ
jgi:hypothetical protein